MEEVQVYLARTAAESAMVADMLRALEFDARPTERSGAEGGTPVTIYFPVYVREEQADAARAALKEQGLDPV